MNLFKKLFAKKTSVDTTRSEIVTPNSNTEPIRTDSDNEWNYQDLKFDEEGWLTYPDGLKLHFNDSDWEGNNVFRTVAIKLGYNIGELFFIYQDYNGNDVLQNDAETLSLYELFTNKLICIVRQDTTILKKKKIELLKSKMLEERTLGTLLIDIGDAIVEKTISCSFIEKVFNKKSNNGILEADKYLFKFKDGMLCECEYDGYNVVMFNIVNYKPYQFVYEEIEDYFTYANKSNLPDDMMKRIINYQAFCHSKIDDDILNSTTCIHKFSYDEHDLCINFIAMAAFYKQCEVEQEMFILSTDGEYEILTKTIKKGIETTRIIAYDEIFTFINGYSEYNPDLADKQKEQLDNSDIDDSSYGYVYVMINPSYPDMVKIGMTKKDPNERAKELSSSTGVPTPFILVYYKPFNDCYLVEQQIHNYLKENGFRVSDNREFFKMPTGLAIEMIQTYYDYEQEGLNS